MDVTVTNNESEHRYEATIDGELAGHMDYTLDGTRVTVTHTEVDPKFKGKGVAGALAQGAIDDMSTHGHRVVPQCDYLAGWLEKHQEYAPMVVDVTA